MARSNNRVTRIVKKYKYLINILRDGTFDMDSYQDTEDFVFFGKDRTIENLNIDSLIKAMERLIDTRKNVINFSYKNGLVVFDYEEYHNDRCNEYRFVFSIYNKYNIRNKFDKEIKRLLNKYDYVKEETDRIIKLQKDKYEDSDRIAKIAYKLIENYKKGDFNSLRISGEDIPKVLNYINNHHNELAMNTKMYDKSLKYKAISKLPIALNALSLGAVIAPFVTKFNPSNEVKTVAINTAAFMSLYNIFLTANPYYRDYIKEKHSSNELDRFIKQYKDSNATWLSSYNQENMEFNYEYSHEFTKYLEELEKLIDDNKNKYNLKNIEKRLRDLKNDFSMKVIYTYFRHQGELDIYLYLNRLIEIEKDLFKIIDGIDFIYNNRKDMLSELLKYAGITRKQIMEDDFLKYVIKDYTYLSNNRYDNMEIDIMDLFSITIEYLENKSKNYDKDRRGNNYLPNYLVNAMSKLAILEKNIANKMNIKNTKKR